LSELNYFYFIGGFAIIEIQCHNLNSSFSRSNAYDDKGLLGFEGHFLP
jgi:hypothetical protein